MRTLLLLAVVASAVVLFVWDPATTWFFPSCPFRALTGWSCPGCGTLRALHELLHGHVGQALRENAFLPAVGLVAIAAAGSDRLRGTHTGTWTRLTSPASVTYLAIAAVAFTVARNITGDLFRWFTP